MRTGAVALAAALLTALWPGTAAAHPLPGVGDFYAGMLHPLMTMEFVLPLIALSLLVGQQGRETAIAMLATIPATLALGAVGGLFVPVSPGVAWVNIGSMAILGVLVAVAPRLPLMVAVGLSALPGAAIGWANGAEVDDQMSAYRFIPGLALAGLMLTTYGVGCVRRLQAPWMSIGFRVVGSWIAAVGVLMLGLK